MNKDILRLAVPSIVSNITVPLLSLVDIAIVGHIGNAVYLAAISVGAMTFNVMYWVLGFLRMGTSGMTAQAFGANDSAGINWLFKRSLMFGLLIGVILLAAFVPIRHAAMYLLQVNDTSKALVEMYFNVCVIGAPAVLGSFALNGFLIGMQNTKTPMAVAILQNVINIILSLIFVYVFEMDIAGVALGTMLSQWLAFIMLLLAVRNKYPEHTKFDIRLSIRTKAVADIEFHNNVREYNAERLKTFFSTNRDIFFRTLCLVSVNLFFTSAGSAQGEIVLAVNTLIMTLFTLFSYVMDGFAFAGEAMAGRFYGAKDEKSLSLLHNNLFLWGLGVTVFFTAVYFCGGDGFLSLLTNDETVIAASHSYTFFALLIPICGVQAFIYDGIFIGLTRTKEMFLSCFIGAAVFFTLYFILFPSLGNNALWIALLSYLLLRGIVLSVFWRYKS